MDANNCESDEYLKWDLDTGDSECVKCPEITQTIIDEHNIEDENSLLNYFKEMSRYPNAIISSQYGDLLLNYKQCGNYSNYLPNNDYRVEQDYARGSRGKFDRGSWDILMNVTEEDLEKCTNNEAASVKENRICEIINYYKNSEGYLEPGILISEINRTFGEPKQISNRGAMEYSLPDGKSVEDYKTEIHEHCGSYAKPIWSSIEDDFAGSNAGQPSKDNIIFEEIYDYWKFLNSKKRESGVDGVHFSDIFSGLSSNAEFEMCMNTIFDNKLHQDKNYDNKIQERIKSAEKISDLSEEEIDYIEDKLKTIATIKPEQAEECMNILNIGESICNTDVSNKMLKMGFLVFHIIGLDKMDLDHIEPGSMEYYNLTRILDRLTPYIRQATKKIIEISKYYEEKMCGRESTTTHVLDVIYKDVFEKSTEVNVGINAMDFVPTYLIKDTNLVEFIKTIMLMIIGICAIYVLLMVLTRPTHSK